MQICNVLNLSKKVLIVFRMVENPLEFVTDIRECFLREMKKPNVLKTVENYFSQRRQLWGVFSGDS